jgi:hypothetical protein
MNALEIILTTVIIIGTFVVLFFCYITYLFNRNDDRINPCGREDLYFPEERAHAVHVTENWDNNREKQIKQAEVYKQCLDQYLKENNQDEENKGQQHLPFFPPRVHRNDVHNNDTKVHKHLKSEEFSNPAADGNIHFAKYYNLPVPQSSTRHFSRYYLPEGELPVTIEAHHLQPPITTHHNPPHAATAESIGASHVHNSFDPADYHHSTYNHTHRTHPSQYDEQQFH